MSNRLKSIGLDVGTTSTQLIVSELTVENRAGSFSVPQMQITGRKILYKSPVHFTPLLDESLVDAEKLKALVEREYRAAGITREQVDTGAVIITGETSRKENAQAVLEALAEFAGEFVVTTAGPDLESVLAAKGAGATEYSRETGETVLHMDIGGGTSNLAFICDGKIVETGCLNVGGRLLKVDENRKITYVSPVLQGICDLQVGQIAEETKISSVAEALVQVLEMAAGLRPPMPLLERLTTQGISMSIPEKPVVVSFSGGVADCIENRQEAFAFGDIGPILGRKIRESSLCRGKYRLGTETIRATVIGAGCHSTQLSGSTVFHKDVQFPLKNLPVVGMPKAVWELPVDGISRWLVDQRKRQDGQILLHLEGKLPSEYCALRTLGEKLAGAGGDAPVFVALKQDMAKALGQVMALSLPEGTPCLCMDGLSLEEESYIDVGLPVGPAIPVVIKTLIFEKNSRDFKEDV